MIDKSKGYIIRLNDDFSKTELESFESLKNGDMFQVVESNGFKSRFMKAISDPEKTEKGYKINTEFIPF